jgi:hypothetical protein
VAAFGPALGPIGERLASLLVIFLDPVPFGLVDPDGRSLNYDLKNNSFGSSLPKAFVQVGGNVELVVIPNPIGTYELNVADAPARARGGAVYFGDHGFAIRSLTDELRAGASQFSLPTQPSAPSLAESGIASAIVALRGILPQAVTVLTLPDLSSGKASVPTDAALSAASSGLAPRTSGAGGPARQARLDSLQAIGEILADLWAELMKEMQGEAAEPAAAADDVALPPVLRTITRILDGMLNFNAPRPTSTQQCKSSDRQPLPTATPRSNPDQVIRSRGAGDFDFQPSQRRVSRSGAPGSQPIPDTNPHAAGAETRPAGTVDSQASPNQSPANGNPTAGSSSRASAT